MKIAVIQASSQKEKNSAIYEACKKAVKGLEHEIINFGGFSEENTVYSYTEIAFLVSLLLSSQSVDFVITGCSSGQGMALACNSLPGVLCGFVQNPQDAFLFGRINDGNAVSLSLGLGYGWLGNLNLQYTLEKLFEGEFGTGYPKESAERKVKDTLTVKKFNRISKRDICEVINELDSNFVKKALSKQDVFEYITRHTINEKLKALLLSICVR